MSLLDQAHEERESLHYAEGVFVVIPVEARNALVELADAVARWEGTEPREVRAALERLRR